MYKKPIRHLLIMLALTIPLMSVAELLGWKILAGIDSETVFPGFLSWEVASNILKNVLLAFLTGFSLALLAFVFPAFRKHWRERIHKPIWIGVIFINLMLMFLVGVGLAAV